MLVSVVSYFAAKWKEIKLILLCHLRFWILEVVILLFIAFSYFIIFFHVLFKVNHVEEEVSLLLSRLYSSLKKHILFFKLLSFFVGICISLLPLVVLNNIWWFVHYAFHVLLKMDTITEKCTYSFGCLSKLFQYYLCHHCCSISLFHWVVMNFTPFQINFTLYFFKQKT